MTLTTEIISCLILPPGINLVLIILGIIFRIFSRFLCYLLVTLGLVSLYFLSTPIVAGWLVTTLHNYPPIALQTAKDSGAQAIVVLTGGNRYAPEYDGGVSLSPRSLVRENYAASLYKATPLPIYVLGGKERHDSSIPEAKVMQDSLSQSYNIPVYWIDVKSENTYEAALYVKDALAANKIEKFYLVTSAWHMPRAMWSFQKFGLNPTPAPTEYGFTMQSPEHVMNWMPQVKALEYSSIALRERFGLWWYKIVY